MIQAVSILVALATAAPAVQIQPATDLSAHTEKQPGFGIRFVDFHWQPELFDAMEKGGSTMPEAKRNWMLARIVTEAPFTLEGTKVPVGNYALALWPNLDGKGLAIELRKVDMRTVLEVNVMAPAPEGVTVYKGSARFETVAETAPRLDIRVTGGDKAVNLEVRYGNRRLPLTFAR
jgi:hypothetical protein